MAEWNISSPEELAKAIDGKSDERNQYRPSGKYAQVVQADCREYEGPFPARESGHTERCDPVRRESSRRDATPISCKWRAANASW